MVGVRYLGRIMGVGLVVGLWFSGGWCFSDGSGWFGGGYCFWWKFFLVILVVILVKEGWWKGVWVHWREKGREERELKFLYYLML